MAKGLVIYFSKTGNTKKMAEVIAEEMNSTGLKSDCKSVEQVKVDDLLAADAVVIGSPTYYGLPAAGIIQLFDDSVVKHGSLAGKVGAAFSSSANIGGGNETTVIAILEAMLIHGMIIAGDAKGDHYGPVSIGKPDERVIKQCKRKAQSITGLTAKLFG